MYKDQSKLILYFVLGLIVACILIAIFANVGRGKSESLEFPAHYPVTSGTAHP